MHGHEDGRCVLLPSGADFGRPVANVGDSPLGGSCACVMLAVVPRHNEHSFVFPPRGPFRERPVEGGLARRGRTFDPHQTSPVAPGAMLQWNLK